MKLSVLPATLVICRLDSTTLIPDWARGDFVSVTRTRDELSIVCAQAKVPDNIRCERNWRALQIDGQLDFALTGILASIATLLADAGISIFAISTFDTDYVLLKQDKLQKAIEVLRQAGHEISETRNRRSKIGNRKLGS